MDKLYSKFNLYDHIGYISVGFYLMLGSFVVLYFNNILDANWFSIGLGDGLLLLLSCYIIGHILQAIANVFIKEDKDSIDDSYDHIIKKVIKYFGLKNDVDLGTVFQYAYLSTVGIDSTGHIALFNSLHSLYRGFLVSTGIIFLIVFFLLFYAIMHCNLFMVLLNIIGLLLFLLLIYVFNSRRTRFYKHMGQKVRILFDILYK